MAGPTISAASAAFLESYPYYVRIDFSCKQINDDNPHELCDTVLNAIPHLCKSIVKKLEEQGESSRSAVLFWPSPFVTSPKDALISREASQDRGTILLAILQDTFDAESIKSMVKEWVAMDIMLSPLFTDYIPTPSIAAHLVKQEDLGKLVPDQYMYPALLTTRKPLLFDRSGPHPAFGVAYDVSTLASAHISTAGTPAAAAASSFPKREPSPSADGAAPYSKGGLTPASAILNRLKWDDAFDVRDYVAVYEDRHAGLMESEVEKWVAESTEEVWVPMHRVRAVKRKSDGLVVWHREERIDLIS